MKRGHSSSNANDGLSNAPPLKRSNSTISHTSATSASSGTQDEDLDITSEYYHLRCQNKALVSEFHRNSLIISNSEEEITLLKQRTSDMQTLVSAINRSWKQLNCDGNLLLAELSSGTSATAASDPKFTLVFF